MLVHIIFYVKNKEKLFLYAQKSFRRGLGNGNYWNMIFPGFPVFPVQEIDHFSCFPAGNSNTRKCATLIVIVNKIKCKYSLFCTHLQLRLTTLIYGICSNLTTCLSEQISPHSCGKNYINHFLIWCFLLFHTSWNSGQFVILMHRTLNGKKGRF